MMREIDRHGERDSERPVRPQPVLDNDKLKTKRQIDIPRDCSASNTISL